MQYPTHSVDPTLPQPNMPPPLPPVSFRTPSRTPWVVAVAMTAAAGYGAYWGFSERQDLLRSPPMEERRMIAIAAAGALTPVGVDLTDTMAALYTHVQLVEDLDVLDNDGEPLSGMKIRFAEDIAGPARLVAMAHAVVDEATLTVEPEEKVPLILCCPEAAAFDESPTDWPTQLLAKVISEAAFSVDRARSRIIARGRAGMIEALGTALALLEGFVDSVLSGRWRGFIRRCRSRSRAGRRRTGRHRNQQRRLHARRGRRGAAADQST